MALFFRGKARKFFLILLGRRRSEKNCAGFGRELSEFSRGVADGFPEAHRRGRSGCVENAGTCGRRPAGPAVGARGPCGKGSRGGTGASSPVGCTAFGLVADAGCPQCRGPRAAGEAVGRAHRSIAQSFESRRRPDVHTSIAPRFERMPTLTVEIHSATSRCRREISTPPDSRPATATFALTCRMHRFASRFGGAISTPLSALALLGSGDPVVTAMQACVRRARVGCQFLRGWASPREHWRGFGAHLNMPSRN